MRLRSGAALVLVLLTCCGAAAQIDGPSGAKAGEASPATRVCDLISTDEVHSIYAGRRIVLTDYAGPVGDPSFDSCQITVDHGTTTGPQIPFQLQVSIDPVTPAEYRELLDAHAGAGILQFYGSGRVLRVQGGGDQNAVRLAELVLPRLPDLAQAEAVLSTPAEERRDRQTVDELRCEWSAGPDVLSATIGGYGDEVGRMWAAEQPGAAALDVGGLRDNGVYLPTGGVYFWMGHRQVSMYVRHRPHVPADDREALVGPAGAFAPTLLDVARRVAPPQARL